MFPPHPKPWWEICHSLSPLVINKYKRASSSFQGSKTLFTPLFSVTDFTQKNKPNHVVRTAEYDKAFQELKLILYSSPVALWSIKELKGLYKQTNQHQEYDNHSRSKHKMCCCTTQPCSVCTECCVGITRFYSFLTSYNLIGQIVEWVLCSASVIMVSWSTQLPERIV